MLCRKRNKVCRTLCARFCDARFSASVVAALKQRRDEPMFVVEATEQRHGAILFAMGKFRLYFLQVDR